jgi:hypothetical protein
MPIRCSDAPDADRRSSPHKVAGWQSALRAALVAGGLLATGGAHGAAEAPVLSSLYADPHQPDISGVWLIKSVPEFTFAPDGSVPSLRGKFRTLYERRLQALKAGAPIDDTTANCGPAGLPHLEVVPYPFEIMQTPGRVTMLYEYDSVVRRIPLGGAPYPGDDMPLYYGTSAGHWEGSTLVIETTSIRADTQVDDTGIPHSDSLRITERIRRINRTTLENRITLTDPKAYGAPFTVTRTYTLHPNWHIEEYVCQENNRNRTDAEGRTGTGAIEH